eukprot:GILI01017000.1.p1 GENE.GILI01017000.1~~GILI01017000.1.p1  ORF type:complete len:328 (-),score=78.30 GILI01017000.1:113-1096(-)
MSQPTSTSAVTEINIARRFLTLSQDFNNRPVVARRNTVPTLLRFLQHQDRDVRLCAAEALANLSDHPENPTFLCNEKGFVAVVFQVYKDSDVADPEVHDALTKVFESLRAVLAADEDRTKEQQQKQEAGNDKENHSPTKASKNRFMADGESARFAKNRRTRISNSITACRNMLIEIDGADEIVADGRKAAFDELLQTTRGVVSYSIDWANGRANLFLSTPTTVLVKLLEDSGFSISVAHESDPVQLGSPSHSARPAHGGPSYIRSGNLNANVYDQVFRHTLVLHGSSEDNTLGARLQRQKEEENMKRTAKDKSHVAMFVSKLTAGWW